MQATPPDAGTGKEIHNNKATFSVREDSDEI
jgi:hypothetical protein